MTITKEEKEMFDYLNVLRDSGVTNMFGAGSYLAKAFKVSDKEASTVLSKWMENFNPDGYDHLLEK
jgi:hypothetical protein